jgi:hypothetical protein
MTEKIKLTLSVVDTIEVMNNNEVKYDADWTLGSVISDSVMNDVGIVCVEKGVGSLECNDVGIVCVEKGVGSLECNDVGIVYVEKGVGSLICDDVGIVLEENGVCTGTYNDVDIVLYREGVGTLVTNDEGNVNKRNSGEIVMDEGFGIAETSVMLSSKEILKGGSSEVACTVCTEYKTTIDESIDGIMGSLCDNNGWSRSEFKISRTDKDTGMSYNIWLGQGMGKEWLRRVTKEKKILQSYYNIFGCGTVGVSGMSPVTDIGETILVLQRASKAGGYRMVLVRRGVGELFLEKTINEGVDGSITVVYFTLENMVKIIKRPMMDPSKGHSYKEILEVEPVRDIRPKESIDDKWEHFPVASDDQEGLTWLLRMHASGKIFRKYACSLPTEGEREWTKAKFGMINKKGKADLLKYLAFKTRSELTIIKENTGKR